MELKQKYRERVSFPGIVRGCEEMPQKCRIELLGHLLCGLYNDTRMPQPAPLCPQGLQGCGHGRQWNDKMVTIV